MKIYRHEQGTILLVISPDCIAGAKNMCIPAYMSGEINATHKQMQGATCYESAVWCLYHYIPIYRFERFVLFMNTIPRCRMPRICRLLVCINTGMSWILIILLFHFKTRPLLLQIFIILPNPLLHYLKELQSTLILYGMETLKKLREMYL